MKISEKIQLLQDISRGKAQADSLREENFLIHIGTEGTTFYVDQKETPTDRFWETFKAHTKPQESTFNIKIVSYGPQR